MQYAVIAVAAALSLAATAVSQPIPRGPDRAAPDSVIVTAAHGKALVPVRIITHREAVLSTSGKGTWSGDTLLARTPLVMTFREAPPLITVQAIAAHTGVRVTLPGSAGGPLRTTTGATVLLRAGPDGWSLTSAS